MSESDYVPLGRLYTDWDPFQHRVYFPNFFSFFLSVCNPDQCCSSTPPSLWPIQSNIFSKNVIGFIDSWMVLVFVQVLKYVIILCEKNHVRETKRKKSTLANSKFIISIRSE